MNSLSFKAAGEQFAVDVSKVMKVVCGILITPAAATPYTVVGLANLKGSIVTILSLAGLLQKDNSKNDNDTPGQDTRINAVIFKSGSSGDNLMGLQIDTPGDLIDIDTRGIQQLSEAADNQDNFCISGTAKAGGELYRIIDIQAIYKKFEGGTEDNDHA